MVLVGYSAATFGQKESSSLRSELAAWLTNTTNYNPGTPTPNIDVEVGTGSEFVNGTTAGWRVPVAVWSRYYTRHTAPLASSHCGTDRLARRIARRVN